jgi:hypothetical protein
VGAEWPLQIAAQGGLSLTLDQRGMDWSLRLEQARALLRALAL